MPSNVLKTCLCGLSFTRAAWRALPLVGYSDLEEDDDQRCEQRNCPCGSTIAIDLGPPPSLVSWVMFGVAS